MASNMVGCRAGAGTDRNPFALVHYPDFRDRSRREAAPEQVVWLWVPSHSPSAVMAAAARPGCWTEETYPAHLWQLLCSQAPSDTPRGSLRQELTVCNA